MSKRKRAVGEDASLTAKPVGKGCVCELIDEALHVHVHV
jgi:hypothetical protein